MSLGIGSVASSLTPKPDIQLITLTEDDEFLIMGCDGTWNKKREGKGLTTLKPDKQVPILHFAPFDL